MSNNRKIRLKPNWFDGIVLLISLLIAIGSLVFVNIRKNNNQNQKGDRIAHVRHDNNEIKTVNLELLQEREFFVMSPEVYPHMMGELTVVFDKELGIAVFDAHCPDKVCQNQGFVNTMNTPIVCLPNNVVVTITKKGSSSHEGGMFE